MDEKDAEKLKNQAPAKPGRDLETVSKEELEEIPARRVVGIPIVIIASCFLVYAYFGPYFPGFLSHRGYTLQRIASHMYLTTEGIMGIPLGVSASFIYHLITSCAGMFGVGAAMIGFCLATMRWYERVWFFVGGLMLIDPGTLTDIIGLVMLASGILYQWRKKKAAMEPGLQCTP